jgi:hypothetical protein
MIKLHNTLISPDIFEKKFFCDLEKCKGMCCVEGESGAPLEENEIGRIEKNLEGIREYMDPRGLSLLEKEGFCVEDSDNELVTNCIQGRDCIFAYEDKGIYYCAIEKAFHVGKSNFRKPVSCHLYPIRINRIMDYHTLNYSVWGICKSACVFGEQKSLPVYIFCGAALIRKFGKKYFRELKQIAKTLERK